VCQHRQQSQNWAHCLQDQRRIEDNGQVVFRYVDNPNGSVNNIAGIMNERGNVLGMMPHPDRAFEAELGSADGATLFRSIFNAA